MPVLETRISEVVVYVDRARVTRFGAVQVEPGQVILEVVGLPGKLNPESLRATAQGTARARLLGVQAQRQHPLQAPQEVVRDLEKALEEIQDQRRILEGKIELGAQNRQALVKILGETQTFATALAAGEMAVEKGLEMLNSLRTQAEQLDADLQTKQVEKRALERHEQQLTAELEKYRRVPKQTSMSARIELDVTSAGELSLSLSYIVPDASWQPLYDLRFSTATDKPALEIGYLAQVIQMSAEDWNEVNLTISTTRPALTGRAPELKPWILKPTPPIIPRPAVAADAMPAPMAARKPSLAKADSLSLMAAEVAPVEDAVAQVETAGAAVVYRIPQVVSIPADGSPHKVTVARVNLQPEIDYLSAPRLVSAVYRRAKLRNESAFTFLPGAVNLFDNDEFLGATRLELVAPQGEIELFLGVEDRLRVERETKRLEVDKRLIGSRRKVVSGYTIDVENLLPVLARLILQDQLPVAGHEEIKIRLENSEPRPTRQSEMNILEWELSLEPGEKRTMRFDYSVEYPQTMELPGMP